MPAKLQQALKDVHSELAALRKVGVLPCLPALCGPSMMVPAATWTSLESHTHAAHCKVSVLMWPGQPEQCYLAHPQSLPQSRIEMALLMAGCMCCSRATVFSCSRVRSDASMDSKRKWLPVRKQLSSMSDALTCIAGMAQAGDWLDSCAACCMSLSAHEVTAGSCSATLPGSCRTGYPSGLNTTQPVCPGRGRRDWRRVSLSKLRAL